MSNFSITNKTRGSVPRVLFARLKKEVLGETYDLSVALVTKAEATRVTLESKNKDTPSNVLSFPLSKTSGEIILCPATARAQAPDYGMSAGTFLIYLFIHGLLHLKGRQHGATMEREERRIMQQFGLRTHE